MAWVTGGQITNPAVNAVMADIGAVPSTGLDLQDIYIVLTSTVQCFFVIQRRNAANTANLSDQAVACAANATITINIPPVTSLAGSERIRVIMLNAVTGIAQASIFY